MDKTAERIAAWLGELCLTHPDRRVGGPGNLHATRLFADECRQLGLEVTVTPFECVDWAPGGATLRAAGREWDVRPGPYSLPCDVRARLVSAGTVDELEAADARGAVLLAHGDLVAEQLTPKRYPFYSWESHTRALAALEAAAPAAIVAATGRNPGITGGLYPYPLIEDADFDIPSAYMTDVEGEALLLAGAAEADLRIASERVPASAEQVVARVRGPGEGCVVVCAHIDSRQGTPGALDNATGVTVLLVLAEMLAADPPPVTVDLVPFNGEDNFAAYGEVVWLAENEGRLGDILLAANIDAAGCRGHGTAVSFYACPDDLAAVVRGVTAAHPGISEGPAWPQSDHMVFAMRGVPAIAITSENLIELATEVTHTPRDLPGLADPQVVEQAARFLLATVGAFGRLG